MRRATFLTIGALLAAPAAAHAKGGVIFDTPPERAHVGQPIHFTVIAAREAPASGRQARPAQGVRPLVTFRSASGHVLRVRATRTDLNGIGYGSVAFTDKGPWTSELRAGKVHFPASRLLAISVGTGLVETTPPASGGTQPDAADRSGGGFPWLWVLSLASIGSALVFVAIRRRGLWGLHSALLVIAALALAVPAAAGAKTGFAFDTYPESAKVGQSIPFTVTVWREPRSSGGRAHSAGGIRPLVIFHSESGRTVSVRAGRTDRFGTAHGRVAFPDKGPWKGVLHLERYGVEVGSEGSQTFKVGTGLVETIPAANATAREARPDAGVAPDGGFPWLWVLSPAAIASALLVLAMRRRGRWGAA
jgi:hypothetical protein